MARLKDLIHEIHRRSLWQVLGIYVVGGWIAFQVAQTLTEGLGLPAWFPGLALGLLIVLLPVVLATAFVREGVGGPRAAGEPLPERAAAPSVDQARGVRQGALTWRNAGFAFVIALGVWGVVATGWMLFARGADGGAPADERPTVAVLPLENRSGLEEDRYFTDGIHDEILTQLYKISRLSVRGRTSVLEYRDSPKNVRQIGEELNARYLMEGGVQRAGGTVRINVQLLDTETDEHVFAETYDRELSLENLLAVQREVAFRIAASLEATLTTEEREQIEKVPTENPEAYDAYLRGLEYMARPGTREEDMGYAQRMLERAVELDPRFAVAYAQLARLHAGAYYFGLDRSEDRLRQAREAAGLALEIDPDLPAGHVALGYYYAVREYDRALDELAIAERGLPGSALLWSTRGRVLLRQGRWDEGLASLERALTLSPREPYLLFNLGSAHLSLRRYDQAERYFDRALALQPDFLEAALAKAMVPLYGRGDTGPLRWFLEDVPPGFDPWGMVTVVRGYVEYLDRDYAAALEVVSESELEYFEAPGVLESITFWRGICYEGLGETERARAAADSTRRDLEARLDERREDPELHRALSMAHALLGHRDEAIRAAQRAIELRPISEDAVDGPDYVLNLATVYAWFGEVDAAVEHFDRFLSVPSARSIDFILLDPLIDPIRDDPRFQALVARYEQ
jgi:TolB-like protein/Flp pilus assembly protein TadD